MITANEVLAVLAEDRDDRFEIIADSKWRVQLLTQRIRQKNSLFSDNFIFMFPSLPENLEEIPPFPTKEEFELALIEGIEKTCGVKYPTFIANVRIGILTWEEALQKIANDSNYAVITSNVFTAELEEDCKL